MSGGFKGYADLGQWFEEPIRENFEVLDRLSREFAVKGLQEAFAEIDAATGQMYAGDRHPALVAAMLSARTEHFKTLLLGKVLQEGFASISENLDAIWAEIVKITDRE